MELVVRKTDLLRELQLFQGIVERKNTIPILANVLIEANGDEVKLLATDLEVGLRSKCQATVSKRGSLTLPAKKLYEIVKALPETDVRIEEDKNGVKVAADRFDSRMQTLPREDFPTLPEATGTQRDAAARRAAADGRRRRSSRSPARTRATSSTARCSSCGPTRWAWSRPTAIGWRSSTWRAKPARARRQGRRGSPRHPAAQDAARARPAARRRRRRHPLRARREPPVLRLGDRLLISRMIDGQFPAFERVIPKNNDKHVEFDRDRLTSAVNASRCCRTNDRAR